LDGTLAKYGLKSVKNRKNCQKIRKTQHFNSIFLKKGLK